MREREIFFDSKFLFSKIGKRKVRAGGWVGLGGMGYGFLIKIKCYTYL